VRVVFTIQHPAHVHLFRYAITELKAEPETSVTVFVRGGGVTTELLAAFSIDHTVLAPATEGLVGLARAQLLYETRLLARCLRLRPDVLVGMGEPGVAHVSTIVGARGLVFTDTEHASLQNTLAFPLADCVITPDCYQDEVGAKRLSYPGYHELAYLHPDRFDPEPEQVVETLAHNPGERVVLLRTVSWDAAHDVGNAGFADIEEVVQRLESVGARVYLSAESTLPPELEDRALSIEPDRMHDALAAADLFIGEGATMAAESAVLGTPAVYVNTLSTGYIKELESEYGLISSCTGPNRQVAAIRTARTIIESYDASRWQRRRRRLLREKTDTTRVILDAIQGRIPNNQRGQNIA
jgi:predicted glycosyltransferase